MSTQALTPGPFLTVVCPHYSLSHIRTSKYDYYDCRDGTCEVSKDRRALLYMLPTDNMPLFKEIEQGGEQLDCCSGENKKGAKKARATFHALVLWAKDELLDESARDKRIEH